MIRFIYDVPEVSSTKDIATHSCTDINRNIKVKHSFGLNSVFSLLYPAGFLTFSYKLYFVIVVAVVNIHSFIKKSPQIKVQVFAHEIDSSCLMHYLRIFIHFCLRFNKNDHKTAISTSSSVSTELSQRTGSRAGSRPGSSLGGSESVDSRLSQVRTVLQLLEA